MRRSFSALESASSLAKPLVVITRCWEEDDEEEDEDDGCGEGEDEEDDESGEEEEEGEAEAVDLAEWGSARINTEEWKEEVMEGTPKDDERVEKARVA